MKLGIYSVLDKAVMAYMTPFFARADGEAMRSFKDACLDTSHNFNKHAADYTLYRLGSFDDRDGTIECDVVQMVAGTSMVGMTD